jgi:hypothetical protein
MPRKVIRATLFLLVAISPASAQIDSNAAPDLPTALPPQTVLQFVSLAPPLPPPAVPTCTQPFAASRPNHLP